FSFTLPPPPHSSPLSLHDALPISGSRLRCGNRDVSISHRLRDATLPIASVRLECELPFLRVVVRDRLDVLSVTADYPLRIDEDRSEEHTSELQSRFDLVCRLLLEK